MNKLLQEDRIEACRLFYNTFHRVPKARETMIFKGIEFKIGQFIYCIKRGDYSNDFRHEICRIFGENELRIKKNVRIDDNKKLEACRKYFNEFHKVPEFLDKIELDDGTMFKIGFFIHHLKHGFNKRLKNEVEQIFQQKIQINYSSSRISNDEKIEACKLFFNEFGRIPKVNETMMIKRSDTYEDEFKIGTFISRVKNDRCTEELKQEVEQIFNGFVCNRERTNSAKILDLIKEYKTLGIKTEKYKGFNMRNLIYNVSHGNYHKSIQEDVNKFLNTLKSEKDQKILNLINDYITKNKHLPSKYEKIDGINLYQLINSILRNKTHKNLKPRVEQIMQSLIL